MNYNQQYFAAEHLHTASAEELSAPTKHYQRKGKSYYDRAKYDILC